MDPLSKVSSYIMITEALSRLKIDESLTIEAAFETIKAYKSIFNKLNKKLIQLLLGLRSETAVDTKIYSENANNIIIKLKFQKNNVEDEIWNHIMNKIKKDKFDQKNEIINLDSDEEIKIGRKLILNNIQRRRQIKLPQKDKVICDDITFGNESIPIPVVNNFYDEMPEQFKYIKQSIIPKESLNDLKHIILRKYKEQGNSCSCKDNYNSNSIQTCTDCNCSKFYKIQTVINDDNQEDNIVVIREKYLDNLFNLEIWECNNSCSCSIDYCINRLVQNTKSNMNINTEVRKTEFCGFGLFVKEKVYKGQYIGTYLGQMILEGHQNYTLDDTYLFETCSDLKNNQGQRILIDSKNVGNICRFINHSCDPNIYVFHVLRKDSAYPLIGLFAGQDLEKGSELYLDYTENYWTALNARGIFCRCKSKNCLYSKRKKLKKTICPYDFNENDDEMYNKKIPTKRRRKFE